MAALGSVVVELSANLAKFQSDMGRAAQIAEDRMKHYTLDANTGVITTVDPGLIAANFAWTGRFYVPVHFLEDSIDWSMVISGPTTDARFLAGPSVILQEIRE